MVKSYPEYEEVKQWQVEEIINPRKMFTGIFIPLWLVERKEISAHAKLIYARLCYYAGNDGRCFPRQETIAENTGMSKRKVQYCLKELVDYRLLKKIQRGLNKSNAYFFLKHPWMDMKAKKGNSSINFELDAHDNALPDAHDNALPEAHNNAHIKEVFKRSRLKEDIYTGKRTKKETIPDPFPESDHNKKFDKLLEAMKRVYNKQYEFPDIGFEQTHGDVSKLWHHIQNSGLTFNTYFFAYQDFLDDQSEFLRNQAHQLKWFMRDLNKWLAKAKKALARKAKEKQIAKRRLQQINA